MSKKEGYNPLLEYDEEAKSNILNNQQFNNFTNSKKKFIPYNTGTNFNQNSNNGDGTQNLLENDYNNLLSSRMKTNNIPSNHPKTSIKWRNVMKIDLDSIRNTNDLSLLSSYLDNFLYSNITEDDIQAVPEGNILKLIKILQFSNEYLLTTRQNLNENIINLQEQKEGLINEHQKLEESLTNQKEYLDKSNKERKLRMKEIADYKNAVSALLQGGVPIVGLGGNTKITDINIDINKNNKYNQSKFRGPLNGYKCKYCIGKIFTSEFELKKHLNDIHLINQFPDDNNYINNSIRQQTQPQINVTVPPINNNNLNNKNNNNKEIFEKKLNEMKMEFQEYMHRNEIDSLKNQLLRQRNIRNDGDDFKQQFEKMGNTFNDTLKQILGVMVKNNLENKKIIIKQKNDNFDNDVKSDEELNKLRSEIDNTKKIMDMKRKEYNEKIINLKKEINILKTQKINIDINKRPEAIPKKTILVAEQKEPISFIKINVKKLGKPFKFHSGPLESDHDDSDNERKKKEKILEQLKYDSKLIDIITKKTEIIPKRNDIESPIQLDIEEKLRTANQKNILEGKDLDDFYRRYINRDTRYLNNSKFDRYLTEVLPNQFSSNKDIKKNAVFDINNKLSKTANLFYNEKQTKILPTHQVKELVKEDKKDLLELIKQTFHGMDLINEYNGMIDPYYTSVGELLNFKDIKRTCKIFQNEDYENNFKTQKLRSGNKKVHFIENNKIMQKDEKDILKNKPPKEEEYGDVQYFSGGNARAIDVEYFSGGNARLIEKNNDINNTNTGLFKNQNTNLMSNQINNIQNENHLTNILNSNNKDQDPKQLNNNKPQDPSYSSARINQNQNYFPNASLFTAKEGQLINTQDPSYSSARINQNPNNAPNVPYSSAREGQLKNQDPSYSSARINQNQNNAPNVPYSSAREGQNQETINTNNNLNSGVFRDINKSNDSWNQMNPMIESNASVQPVILNRDNVIVQDISSKIVQAPK